ncbi:uracil-xanthine permease family protein [Clostridium sp. DSM 100503]|uniref:uracil-xanthine permease family protein n=1 Tax=Clostridium sp. DSM 100503 TaxID=2963282 RepID=UPI00214A8ABF|nr:uracil-xanthine permease family protein [Clostridium sp. DSM 100503]MCR1950246.1 uracil-xanthine permease family protein [Clostridium sp. DSM 100503]
MAQYVETKETNSLSNVKRGLLKSVLGLQHLIAMFGATVLVPIITGLDPSVALFSAGIGTIIFHLCTKGKVPVFLGSSFAFIPVIGAVATQYGDLRYAQGGMFVAGLIYALVSFIVKKIGVSKIRSILPAQVVGPMIVVIGVNLIPTALDMAGVNSFMAGKAGSGKELIIAIITLGLALCIKRFTKGFISQLSIIIAVIVGYTLSLVLGQVDITAIQNASFIAVPKFTLPKFDSGAIMIVVPVILAVFMEHIGDITTNGTIVGKNFIEDPGLNRTLLGDGLATMTASLIGGPANTTYGENTGVLAITKNYDPSILRLTAVFAIILSFIDKFGAVIRTIPSSVMGGISIMLFSMIALVGVNTVRNEGVKFNIKNIIVIITIIFIGLSGLFMPKAIGINITDTVSISGLSLSALVGVTLNIILTKIFK